MKYKVYIWGDEGEVVVHIEADNEEKALEKLNNMIDIFVEKDDDDEDADE